jgi:hypothetical protein
LHAARISTGLTSRIEAGAPHGPVDLSMLPVNLELMNSGILSFSWRFPDFLIPGLKSRDGGDEFNNPS